MTNERVEALQAVVDRVSSYQDSAPDGTVEKEFRSAVEEAGVDVTEAEVTALVAAIEEGSGGVDVADVLG